MSKPGITSPIIGPRTSEQLQDSLIALDVEVTDEDHARLDAAAPPESVTVSYLQYKGAHQFHW